MKTFQSIFIVPVKHYLSFLVRLLRNEIVYHHSIMQSLRELISIYEIFLTVTVSFSIFFFLFIEYISFGHSDSVMAVLPLVIIVGVTVMILFFSRAMDLSGHIYSIHYLFLYFTAYYYSDLPGVMDAPREIHAWYLIALTVVISQALRPGKFPGLPVIGIILVHGLLFPSYRAAGLTDVFHLLHFLWVSFIVLFTESILYFTTLYFLELKFQKLQQQEELILAQRVYNNLFPVFTENESISMSVYRHAENQTGGDLYDIIQLREGNLGFFLADVSGHGISSAIMSAAMKAIIYRMPFGSRSEPEHFLHYLDKSMSNEYGSHHASAVYLFFDFINNVAKVCNAGHPPVLYSKKGKEFTELQAHGTLIGLGLNQKDIPQVTLKTDSGDRFLIYTDGLLEYEDKNGDVAESVNMLALAQQNIMLNGDDFIQSILTSITSKKDFSSFRDDVLIVLLEIR
jgi:hypothetical protein